MARKINTDDPNLRKAVEELTMKALEDEDLEDISGGDAEYRKALTKMGGIMTAVGAAILLSDYGIGLYREGKHDALREELKREGVIQEIDGESYYMNGQNADNNDKIKKMESLFDVSGAETALFIPGTLLTGTGLATLTLSGAMELLLRDLDIR